MKPRTNTLVVVVGAGASIAVLVMAAWSGRGLLVETWYIHRLGSEDEEARLAAAKKLGEMGSLRAVPALLETLRGEEKEWGFLTPLERTVRDDGLRLRAKVYLTPILHSIWRIGRDARELVKEEKGVPDIALPARYVGRRPAEALGIVLAVWEHESAVIEVRKAPYNALGSDPQGEVFIWPTAEDWKAVERKRQQAAKR